MTRLTSIRFSIWMLLLLVAAPMLGWYQSASAADPKFVGVLALAVEEEGAKRLNLSEETLEKLLADKTRATGSPVSSLHNWGAILSFSSVNSPYSFSSHILQQASGLSRSG